MKYLFTSKSARSLPLAGIFDLYLACALSVIGLTPVGRACGPDFPNRYLDAPEGRILASPEAVFAAEIARIAPRERTAATAMQRACAGGKKFDAGAEESALRAIFGDVEMAAAASILRDTGHGEDPVAAAYGRGRTFSLLTQRCEGVSDDDRRKARVEAVRWFRLTRALVEAGARDEANLSRESVGWEAFAELHTGNFVQAITLYLRHHQEGDDTAINSLRFVMRALFRDQTWRKNGLGEKLVCDDQARRVWTAWLLAQNNGWSSWDDTEYLRRVAAAAQDWAELLNGAGVCDVPEADRFAWVAYQGGNFALSREWVRLAPADSGLAEWLRGKLALRAGDLAGGEGHLRAAVVSDELKEQRTVILGELGRVCLARNCASGALEAWMSGGHWEDAAYVAERVMSLEELRAFVDECGERTSASGSLRNEAREERNWWRVSWGPLEWRLRHLLARRLMRTNQVEEAEKYFPEELRGVARDYAADVRAGFDVKRSDKKRAAAFWRAAKVARECGMELLGTELEPDWAIWGGSYDTSPAAAARTGPDAGVGGMFAATTEELARVTEHAVPEKRFHYRYRAAQLAWWAAALMPNNAEETAAILSEAGGWLKHRDPKAAKEFYQALAIRCGRTEWGKRAAERRWFPEDAKTPDS